MAGIQTIPTYTTIMAVVPAVDVTTYYLDENSGEILNVFINSTYTIYNGNPIKEGYGIVIGTDNFPGEIDLEIDINGDLLVVGDDANKYSLDANGNLIYTS